MSDVEKVYGAIEKNRVAIARRYAQAICGALTAKDGSRDENAWAWYCDQDVHLYDAGKVMGLDLMKLNWEEDNDNIQATLNEIFDKVAKVLGFDSSL